MTTSLKTIVSIAFLLCCTNVFCLDHSQEYQLLYNDLINWNSIGYRSHFDEISYQGSEVINKIQGSLIRSTDQRDIAINGYGYFCLKDENGNEYYSRKSKIIVYENEFGLVPDELMNINETVVISNQQKFIVKHDGRIITKNAEIGKVDIYDFDTNDIDKVVKDRIYIKQGAKVNTVITSDIIQFCLETSNVNIEQTLCRMLYLLELKCITNWESKVELVKLLLGNKCNLNGNNSFEVFFPFLALDY